MNSILKQTLVAALLLTVLFACSKTQTGSGELRSSGDIVVNGTGFGGSVHAGTKVLYTLRDLHEGQNYTLRTEIGLLSDGLTPDGTLAVDIYASRDAFINNPVLTVESARPQKAPNANIYEVHFKAPSSGDFVVAISGASSIPGLQFFFNLRLMSADSSADPSVITAILAPVTSETGTTYAAIQTNPLNPDFLNIYNGGDVASSGTYTISLISNATTTIANPQIFVYLNSSLTVTSLMVSSIPTSTQFVITRFQEGVPDSANAEHKDTDIITGVTFTSSTDSSVTGTDGGPFIVLKGLISAVTYTLSVSP